jgi:AhpD family alkylhydroperoxidase
MKPMRRLARLYAKLRYRNVPEPLDRWWPHGGVFWAWSIEETIYELSWRALPARLRLLATLKAASAVDCPWCLDFGSAYATRSGLTDEQLHHIHDWREASCFDADERLVLAYAEQLSATPVTVDEQLADQLRDRLGEKGLVELTATVALENQRSRFNRAMGVLPQGWSRVCALPTPATVAG